MGVEGNSLISEGRKSSSHSKNPVRTCYFHKLTNQYFFPFQQADWKYGKPEAYMVSGEDCSLPLTICFQETKINRGYPQPTDI